MIALLLAVLIPLGFGAEADPGPRGATLPGAPVLLWQVQLPGTPQATATRSEPGSPVVVGDRIYVGFTGQSALLVLDRNDGRLLGTFPARAPVATPPVIDAGRVWFSDTAGYTFSYLLDQLSAPTPTPAWSHYSGAPIVSGPTAVGDVLYIANVDDTVYALDRLSGELKWRYAHRLDASRSGSLELFGAARPVLVKDTVWVGFSDGFLVGLSAGTGDDLQNMLVGEGSYPDIIAPPYVDAGATSTTLIAAGFSGPLVSVDPATRVVRWRLDVGTGSEMLDRDGVLYVGGSDGKLRAVVARTGELKWTWDPGVGGTIGAPVWTDGGLLVTAGEGSAYLVSIGNGKTLWTFDPGVIVAGIASRPAVDGRNAYIVTNAGRLYALRVPEADRVLAPVPWVSPEQ